MWEKDFVVAVSADAFAVWLRYRGLRQENFDGTDRERDEPHAQTYVCLDTVPASAPFGALWFTAYWQSL